MIEMESVNQRQKQWIYAILVGVINIVIGALLVIFKRDSLCTILIIAGVLLVINGAIAVLGGLMDKAALPVIIGAIFIGIGIALIILPNLFTDIFMVLLAILLIITGVSGAISSFDTSDAGIAGRIIALVIAIAMIAAGVITLFNLNEAADWLMIVIGVIMIVSGILNILGGVLEYRNLKA